MIPASKTIMYTLSGASALCAMLLIVLYGASTPPSGKVLAAAAVETQVTVGADALTAKAAVVYDPATKQTLYAKNADMRLPLASLTKLMAAEAVLAGAPASTSVLITPASLAPDGDWGFKPGESWNLIDLVRFGLVASSNDAMAAAAGALGGNAVDMMNSRARALGLTQTYFFNPTGLDLDVETAGAYGSAHDVAVLASDFLAEHPAIFEATAAPSVTITSGKDTLTAAATTAPLGDIPGLIGAKTGYTDLAGGNLVAAVDIGIGHPVIVVVLGSTEDGRFADVKTLISKTREAFASAH